MKVNGIIAEYNPFHKGHKFHIETAKAQTGADFTVVVMSGNFVQRGEPALMDKYTRAKMALLSGADLVLELPALFATASAEYFALGGVSLLDKLGVVDYLSFGSECGDIAGLRSIATLLHKNKEVIDEQIKEFLKQGHTYPKARALAIKNVISTGISSDMLDTFENVLHSPNNILGIEYCKALLSLNSNITPTTIKREGAGYHDTKLDETFGSALSIRNALANGDELSILKSQIPEEFYALFEQMVLDNCTVDANDFSQALYYKLINECESGFEQYLDVTKEISDRIKNELCHYTNFTDFCQLLKTKDITYTRISRCLVHILLNITKMQMEQAIEQGIVSYARILGFRKEAAPLLTAIKQNGVVPLLSKLADAKEFLDEATLQALEHDIFCGKIYRGAAHWYPNEYSTPMIIL